MILKMISESDLDFSDENDIIAIHVYVSSGKTPTVVGKPKMTSWEFFG